MTAKIIKGDKVRYTFPATGKSIVAEVLFRTMHKIMLRSNKGIISIPLNKMLPIIKKIK